jgi:co-chaperonin GroES (HSP10)
MNIQPLRDLIYCKRHPGDDRVGSIVLAKQAIRKSTRCDVVAVGPECREISQNDIVHINTWEGLEQELNGETIFVIHEDEVQAIEYGL